MLYGGWDQLRTPMSKQAAMWTRHVYQGVAVVFLNLCTRTGRPDVRETARARTTYRDALRFALQAARRLATRSQPIGRDTQSNPRKQPLARLTVDSSLSR